MSARSCLHPQGGDGSARRTRAAGGERSIVAPMTARRAKRTLPPMLKTPIGRTPNLTMMENETRTLQGACPEHGRVRAVKDVPKVKFPFVITGPARGFASLRPYRCPECGGKVS